MGTVTYSETKARGGQWERPGERICEHHPGVALIQPVVIATSVHEIGNGYGRKTSFEGVFLFVF